MSGNHRIMSKVLILQVSLTIPFKISVIFLRTEPLAHSVKLSFHVSKGLLLYAKSSRVNPFS